MTYSFYSRWLKRYRTIQQPLFIRRAACASVLEASVVPYEEIAGLPLVCEGGSAFYVLEHLFQKMVRMLFALIRFAKPVINDII
jgi:hypothetical protein